MNRRPSYLAMSVLLGACGGENQLFVEAPDLDAAGSLLLAIEPPTGALRIRAFDARPSILELDEQLTDETRITLIALEQELDALGLVEGRLAPAAPPADTIDELTPISSRVSIIVDGQPSAIDGQAPSRSVLDFPIRTNNPCPEFDIEPAPDIPHSIELSARRLRDGTSIAYDANSLIYFNDDASFETWSSTSAASLRAVAQTDDDRIFVLDGEDLYEVVSTKPLNATRIARLGTLVATEDLRSLHIVSLEPDLEILSLSTGGVLFRYRAGQWSEVLRAGPEIKREDYLSRPSVLSLEDGKVIGIAASMTQVMEINGDRAAFISVGAISKGFVATLEDERRGRLIVDTYDGQVFRYEVSAGWRMDFATSIVNIYGIIPWRGGYVVAADNKGLRAVFPDEGIFCAPTTVGSYERLHAIANVGGRILIGGPTAGGSIQWSWVTPPTAN